jgi:hypothetical protein
MVEYGIAETKNEAIRVAILNFGIERGLLSEQTLIKSFRVQLAEGKISQEKVADKIERVKIESFRSLIVPYSFTVSNSRNQNKIKMHVRVTKQEGCTRFYSGG